MNRRTERSGMVTDDNLEAISLMDFMRPISLMKALIEDLNTEQSSSDGAREREKQGTLFLEFL